MKKETKALIEWIKAQIKVAAKLDDSYLITIGTIDAHQRLEKEAEKFLDSLPEIESHLCRGGYIQDRNGTPCCHGDLIRIIVPEGNGMTGRLCWSDTDKNFSIRNASKKQVAYFVRNLVFEKVEIHEVQSYKDIK